MTYYADMKTNSKNWMRVFCLIILAAAAVSVYGQASKPVLAVLNKADATLAFVDPVTMKLTGKVPTGDGPHEVVFSEDGKTAFVANYGAQTPGSSLSVIDVATAKETRRVDLSPLMRPHGIQMIGGKLHHGQQRLLLTLGQAYARQGDREKAKALFDEALTVNGTSREAGLIKAELARLAAPGPAKNL
ncbi:hypothetical protein BH20ACI2_BH20ACI2_24250 [soil metagenome]